MGRFVLLALMLCAGCAGDETYVTGDGVWGDMAARFSSAPRYAPTSTVSSPAFYPDLSPEKSPAAPEKSPPAAP